MLAALLYVGTAGWPALLDDADSSHALVARDMNASGDYVVLRLDGVRYLQKAPLHYWMVAGLYRVFGENEFSTRLPDALAIVGLVLMIYFLGRRFFGDRAGFYGGLAVATGIGFWMFTRIMIPEAIYTFFFAVIFYLFLRAWTGSLDPRLGYWGAAAVMGLAVLTRALIAVIFPCTIVFLFLIATGGWRRWRELRLFSSAGIFLLIAAPWHLLAEMRAPGFAWWYFINEHFKRALGTRWPPDYDAVPLWAWLLMHLAWWFPWTIFLPLVARQFPRRPWKALDAAGQAKLLLFIWAGFILFFFSLTGGSRMEYYSFAAWPAAALLLGLALARSEAESAPALRWCQGALAVLGVIIAGVLGYAVWVSSSIHATGDISEYLNTRETDFYRVSMAHMMDLRPEAFAVLRAPAIGAALSFLLGFGAAWLLRRRGKHVAATLAMTLAMVGFTFSANVAFGEFEPQMSSRVLARAVTPYLDAEDPIVVCGEFDSASSLVFYTGRRRAFIWHEIYNTMGSMARLFPDSPKLFLDDAGFAQMWHGPVRVFLFVPPELKDWALARLPADGTYRLEEFGGKTVYVNQRVRPDIRSLAELAAAH